MAIMIQSLEKGLGMHWVEAFANVLDAAAFLFVTVELYGLERLERLRQNILGVKLTTFNAAEPFINANTKKPVALRVWFAAFLVLVAITAGFWMVLYFGLDLVGLLFGRAWTMPELDDYKFFFFAIGFIIVFGALLYILWLLRGLAIHGLIYLMKIFKLEGMMIATGAAIFLITRLILFVMYGFIAHQ
jgi:hypothetical protein